MSITKFELRKSKTLEEKLAVLKKEMEDNFFDWHYVIQYAEALSKNYETVEEAYDLTFQINKKNARVAKYILLSRIELSMGDYNQAKYFLELVPKEDRPNDLLISINSCLKEKNVENKINRLEFNKFNKELGDYYMSFSDYEKALFHYKKFLNSLHKPYDAYIKLLFCYYKLNKKDEINSILEKMKEIDEKVAARISSVICIETGYRKEQFYDYNEKRLINHLDNHKIISNKKPSLFIANFDFEKELKLIYKNLTNDTFFKNELSDHFIIEFDKKIGTMFGFPTKRIEVITHCNSKKILTMYPVLSQFPLEYREDKIFKKIY